MRERIRQRCEWLGVELDHDANATGEDCITLPESPAAAWIIPTNVEKIIALHTVETLGIGATREETLLRA